MNDYQIKGPLPVIRGALAPLVEDEDIDVESVKQFQYGGSIDFQDILFNLIKLTGKHKEYTERQKKYKDKRLKKQVKVILKKKKKAAVKQDL